MRRTRHRCGPKCDQMNSSSVCFRRQCHSTSNHILVYSIGFSPVSNSNNNNNENGRYEHCTRQRCHRETKEMREHIRVCVCAIREASPALNYIRVLWFALSHIFFFLFCLPLLHPFSVLHIATCATSIPPSLPLLIAVCDKLGRRLSPVHWRWWQCIVCAAKKVHLVEH